MNAQRFAVWVIVSALLAGAIYYYWDKPKGEAVETSVLQRGILTDPESLDPHKIRSTQAGDVLRDIGEGLTGYTENGELVPGAAETWADSTDGLSYTFTIRADARWSNGDAVTAYDFEFSLKRLADPATAAFNGYLVADIVNAAAITAGEMDPSTLGVEAVDERTLRITLVQPTPYVLDLLTHPSTFPVHPPSVAAHGDDFSRPGTLLSNGAYKIDAWEPGSVLKLSRNEQYWNNGATAIDRVNHHVITQEMTELNRYRAGELHITSAVPPDSFKQLREERPDELRVAPYLGVYYYGFNLSKPPFKDNPKLREALSMAIDREVLAEQVMGRGEAPAYSWVPPGMKNYEPRQLSYAELSQKERNARARRLLLDAGYGPDNPLKFELRYNTNDTQQRMAVAIKAMWKEALGVEAELINEEFKVLLANVRDAEITQVFRLSWTGDYVDPHSFLSIMQSNSAANTPKYASEEFDDRMKQAAAKLDPKRRGLFLEEAERALLADHPVIPIYFYVSKHLVSPQVKGWGDNLLDYHYSQHLSLAPASATR